MGLETIVLGAVFAASAAVAYTGYQKAKKAAAAAAERARGVVYQVRAAAMPRRILYGRVRVGAYECYVGASGEKNEYLHYIVYWGEGPCHEVESILFDGVVVATGSGAGIGKYAGFVEVRSRLGGTDNETPIAEAVAQLPGWESTDKLLGVCYSWVRLKYDEEIFPNGVPSISAIIKGRNDIRDSRDSTYKYTNNVQLCFSHYLTQARVGPNVQRATEIDEGTEIESANICDEAVTLSAGGTEPRYTFDGIVTLEDEPEAIIESFRTAMAGAAVYVSGKWRFYAGAYIVPTFEITQDMMVGPLQLQTKTSKSDHINTVKGIHVSPCSEWQPTDFSAVTNQDYIEDDGEELTEDIELVNTQSPTMCRRIASIYLERARRSRTVTVKCNVEALRAQPGLPILLTFPRHGFNQTPMEVLEYSLAIEDNQIGVNLMLRETSPAVYATPDDLGLLPGDCSSQEYGPTPTMGRPADMPPGVPGDYDDLLTQLGIISEPAGSLLWSYASVTPEIKGWGALHPAYVEPIPRKWKALTYSGSLFLSEAHYCGSITSTVRMTANGTAVYNPDTNVITPVVATWQTTGMSPIGPCDITSACSCRGPGSVTSQFPFFADSATTGYRRATKWVSGVTDQCPLVASQDPGETEWEGFAYCMVSSGQVSVSLGDEDEESNAETRARAIASWAGWSTAAPISKYQARITGFSWSEILVKLKGPTGGFTGATPGWPYKLTISTQTRNYGSSDTWADYDPVEFTAIADSEGKISIPETDFSCPRGKERKAVSVTWSYSV